MIKIEKAETWGWEHAIRGMRNPMNSWDKSDSYFTGECENKDYQCDDCIVRPNCTDGNFWIGDKDKDLMTRLIRGGTPHRKFLRQIFVSADITAPLYWWKQFDTYKVGVIANSCSTMHKIADKEFTLKDFSYEHLELTYPLKCLDQTIRVLNIEREKYLKTKDKNHWWQMIQLLPSSYNQKRTVTMTYENLLNILEYRRGHKLDEWRQFCEWILTLPYGELLKEGLKDEQS